MKILNLKQGSPKWIRERTKYFCASDAAAMRGASANCSRDDLLAEMALGEERPISDYVRDKVFGLGHELEELARPRAEEIIGEELYTSVGANGKLLASFDGHTMDESILFEHKQWNETLGASVVEGIVPEPHLWQLEQQLEVSGAEKVLFVVSDLRDPENEKWASCWYESNPARLADLLDGWDQFAKDKENYVPVDKTRKPVAAHIEQLPSLQLIVTGEVSDSNLPAFRSAARDFFDEINMEPETDEDFSNAEATVKHLKSIEEKLQLVKQQVIGQTKTIEKAFNEIDAIHAESRTKRLNLEKAVTSQKKAIKEKYIREAREDLDSLIAETNNLIAPGVLPPINADFIAAVKNKRTMKSLQEALRDELANAKIEVQRLSTQIQTNMNYYRSNAGVHEGLFPDIKNICMKDADDFRNLMKMRIQEHKEKIEAPKKQEQEDAQEIAPMYSLDDSDSDSGLRVQAAISHEIKDYLLSLDLSESLAIKVTSALLDNLVPHVSIIEQTKDLIQTK